jgi:crossover junction endodeoxyribonuclease RusA
VNGTGVHGGVDGPGGAEEAVRSLRIVAHGAPATQGSKKAFLRGKKIVMVEMDEKLPGWRATVESAARLAAGPKWDTIDSAVSISGEIRLLKPQTTKYPASPAGTPDLDKLQRAIGDALTKAAVIKDDARITHWNIRKTWADLPGMDITITEET